LRREENRRTRRKTLGARTRTNNKLNPLMTPGPGFETGPWEASAITTAPSLLPCSPERLPALASVANKFQSTIENMRMAQSLATSNIV